MSPESTCQNHIALKLNTGKQRTSEKALKTFYYNIVSENTVGLTGKLPYLRLQYV